MAIRMARCGTKHGHASGKLLAMQDNTNVELVGVYEPDAERRAELEGVDGAYAGVPFLDSEEDILDDGSIVAVASEGLNAESLEQTARIVEAGKHVWCDKPAGDDWGRWKEVVQLAKERRFCRYKWAICCAITTGFSRLQSGSKTECLELFTRCEHICRPIYRRWPAK